jgi:hypothetical protein
MPQARKGIDDKTSNDMLILAIGSPVSEETFTKNRSTDWEANSSLEALS